MSRKPIGKARCEHCGEFFIMTTEVISIWFNGDEYHGITPCAYCSKTIYVEIEVEKAEDLRRKGVKVFSWFEGELKEELV